MDRDRTTNRERKARRIGSGSARIRSSTLTSIPEARELTLRQDLHVMRAVLDQYTVDKHKRPSSLYDLVATGYLKQVPTDPMTGRNDSWAAEWSTDLKTPGIVNIRSGSHSISSKGNA